MAGINVKINKSATFYHTIRGFINMKQCKAEPKDAFKLHFDNVYDTMELADGENILRSEQITKNGIQAIEREQQAQIYHMRAMCFLLSADQNMHNLLVKKMRGRDNIGRD